MTEHIVGQVDKKVALYQKYSSAFTKTLGKDVGWVRPYAIEILKKYLNRGWVILDIGCRTGYYLPILGPKAIGLEAVEKFVEDAKSVGRKVVHGDAHYCHEYFPPDYFDAIFSHNTLEHLDDPTLAIENMRKVIKKGGIALHIFPKEGKGVRLSLAKKGSVSKHRCSMPTAEAVKEIVTPGWEITCLEISKAAKDWILVLEAV